MKDKILILLFLSFKIIACGQTRIRFDSTSCHLGRYEEGSKLSFVLKFKNEGIRPITILRAYEDGDVGVCYYPKDPISPNRNGEITWIHPTDGRISEYRPRNVVVKFQDTTIRVPMYYEIVPRKEDGLNDKIKH